MENVEELNVGGIHDKLSSTDQTSASIEIQNEGSQEHCDRAEDWGESAPIDSHHTDYSIYQEDPSKEGSITPSVKLAVEGFSTEEIMKIAGERFIKCSTQTVNVASTLNNCFDLYCLGLTDEDAKKVKLDEFLLASADNVSNQQYDHANILLDQCDASSSVNGNATERVVYYFSKALRERISRETGRITLQDLEKLQSINIDDENMASTAAMLACYIEIPLFQAGHFAGIQTITENVSEAKRIHVIDLAIRMGVQWTVLMQALVSLSACPLELLKITTIGITNKHLIEEIGKRLERFALSMNIPFCFKVIMVSDMKDLKENLFELDAGETVVVYSGNSLRSILPDPDRLNSVMKVIRNLNPRMMVVIEPEVNTCSLSFVNRFIEALFYFSAYFDCLEACMGNDPNRIILESTSFAEGIRNIIVFEGKERKSRNAKLDVWRAFFARFGMEEAELSKRTLCQANMVAKKFACGTSCTLEMDGKSLLIGWKGTPLHSLSAWRFFSK